ncbi:MAG: tripartite tricarboxylate transporter substrate binding protein [Alphaproteobacteria bacterium]|nr:tripartite tricarboxylate transporter substrate binding protein [Alphaproteobacteria bacterium]
MNRTAVNALLAGTTLAFAMGAGAAVAADWQPDRPINIIVPWAAGGSTDQVTRVVAPLLEAALGTPIVIVNQPGASGSIGTGEALKAPRDGYTWTANAIANNATYAISGMLEDTSIDDYRIYLHVANVPVVSVNADSEYQDFATLLEDLKTKEITVGTAGATSSGGMALSAINDAVEGGLAARMVTYDGGAPAVLAAASGEVVVTTQLAVEQTEQIRAGMIRPLTVLSDTPLTVEGLDPVPPITDFIPDFPVAADYFGVFIPVGGPQEVYDTVDKIWAEKIMTSPELQAYANAGGAVFAPSYGDEAYNRAMPVVIHEACALKGRGEAVRDPADFGIDCAAE